MVLEHIPVDVQEPRNEKTFTVHAVSWEIDWWEELRRSKASGSKSKCDWVSQPPGRLWYSIAFGLWPDWMWSYNQSLKEIGNLCVWRHGVVRTSVYPSHGVTSVYPSHGVTSVYPSHGVTSVYPSHGVTSVYPSHGVTSVACWDAWEVTTADEHCSLYKRKELTFGEFRLMIGCH